MRKHWRWFAALAILLVVVPTLWLSPTFEGCIHAIPNYAAYQQYPESLPFLVFFWGSYGGCVGPFVDHNSDALIAAFTVVLAWSTIGLWGQTKRLAEGAEAQTGDMKQSIAAAQKAAIAAERSSESYQNAERAWIAIIPPDSFDGVGQKVIQGVVENIRGTTFILKATNAGKTPARNCINLTAKTIANPNTTPPTPRHYENLGIEGGTKTGSVGPGQNIFVGQYVVTDAEVAAIKAGTKNLFLYTRLDYTDVFKPDIPRVSEACFWVRYKGTTNGGNDVWMYFPVGPQNQTT